jgi:penicillin-binding protein 1C
VGTARLLLPGDGDEYLLEPDVPLADQSIPLRALAPAGVAALEIRSDAGPRVAFATPFSERLPAERGAHRVELYLPGAPAPAAIAHYVVW